MSLPDSYTLKPNAIPAYFDALLDARPPERFSVKFLENLGFTSTNDRLFVGILKNLGFLNRDGSPESRYLEFLDRSRSRQVLAEAIKEAFAELFAINTKANEMPLNDVKNKFRTLYGGSKTPLVIGNIAKTFKALCEYADFVTPLPQNEPSPEAQVEEPKEPLNPQKDLPPAAASTRQVAPVRSLSVAGLQYHVNIVLPDSRDQAVYDAIFKSLREHLG